MEIYYFTGMPHIPGTQKIPLEFFRVLMDLTKKKNGNGGIPLQPRVLIPRDNLEAKIARENDKVWLPSNNNEFLYPIIEQIFPSVNYSSYLQV